VKIVLLGKDGQVGWELQRSLAPLGELVALGRSEADLECPEALLAKVRALNPQVIVNAAAYTAVDKAESDAVRARAINAETPAKLSKLAGELGAWLVHYSSDYVFDGMKPGPYGEADATGPLSVYGSSKLAGETAIAASGCRHLMFRTSWVFAPRGGNFARTMLKLATERERLSVVNDQFGAPTSAELIADVTALCLYRALQADAGSSMSGLYHLVAAGRTSWFDFAKFVLQEAEGLGVKLKVRPDAVLPIPSCEYRRQRGGRAIQVCRPKSCARLLASTCRIGSCTPDG
jgi:dTDP-4-dehydrorhamnose reductase